MAVDILLIDDSPFDCELAARALRHLPEPPGPVELVCAGSWLEAEPHLESRHFDLLLLDFHLPGLDGLEILQRIADRAHPPVVMLTGQDDLATAVATLRAGARDYVPKAASWDDALCLTIERVLERLRLERQLAEFHESLRRYAFELEGKVATRTAVVEAQARQLELLYLKADEGTRVKEELLQNLSHELRTPLHGVLGFTRILEEDLAQVGDPTVLDHLHTVREQGERLLRLVDSLLSLTRLRAGDEGLRYSCFRLSALLDELRADAIALQGDKGLTIDWTGSAKPDEVENDREKIRAIAYHLVSNAIKFTPAGRVGVVLERTPAGGVRLTVADTGIGLAPEVREAVFEDFRQADGSTTRRYEGLGLGLSLVKRYVALLRGSLRLEGTTGKGTTVVVDLPPAIEPGDGGTGSRGLESTSGRSS